MRVNLFVFSVFVTLTVVSGSVLKDRVHDSETGAGEALYLTEYIENGTKIGVGESSRNGDWKLFRLLTVNKKYNSNMMFWFIRAEENPDDAPVLLWLNGGPGGASIPIALVMVPYLVNSSVQLVPNEYSWQKNHNIIFIDNPVGTGFSFTDSDDGYAQNQDDVARDLLSAMHQFFLMFPKLQKNQFIVYGVSYAGKYAPAIAHAIHQANKQPNDDPQKPKINLSKIVMAAPFTDPINQMDYADYFYQLGLIDSHGYELVEQKQNQIKDLIQKHEYIQAHKALDEFLYGMYTQNGSTLLFNLTGMSNYHNFLNPKGEPYFIEDFLQKNENRRALHVGNNPSNHQLKVFSKLIPDYTVSYAHLVGELLNHYPILMYFGQLDIAVAYPLAVNFVKKLEFNGAEAYKTAERHIWVADNEVAGYVKQAGNLTEVLIKVNAPLFDMK